MHVWLISRCQNVGGRTLLDLGQEGRSAGEVEDDLHLRIGFLESVTRCLEGVRGVGISEIMSENPVANESRDPAEKNSRRDEK